MFGPFDFFATDASSTNGSSVGMAANDMFGNGSLRQAKLAHEQMDWQSRENENDRTFQREMMDLQNRYYKDQQNFNYGIWKQQFDLTNAYNTPEAQINRLLDAGVNPYVLFPSSGATPAAGGMSSATPSSSNPSVPNGVAAHHVSPTAGISGTGSPGIGILNSITQGLKNIADAKKIGLDTKFMEDTYEAEVKRVTAQSQIEESKATIEGMNVAIKESNMPYLRKESAYKSLVDISMAVNNFANADAKEKEGKYYQAVAEVKHLEKIAQDYRNTRLKEYCDAELGVLESERQRNVAAAQEHKEGAQLHIQQRLNEKALTRIHSAEATIKEWEEKRENDPEVQQAKIDNLLKQLKNEGLIEDNKFEELQKQLYQSKTWNNYYGVHKQILTVLKDMSDAITILKP